MAKIIKLTSENVKRLHAVEITPDGSMIVIGGKNGAGKTSILDSIEYALGGKGSIPDVPIRTGEDKARVVVETEELVITRTFTKTGSYLKVANRDGMQATSAQAMLDKLTGTLTFDPVEFSRMGRKRQKATLSRLIGLDFSELEAERKEAYEARTAINSQAALSKARLGEMTPTYPDIPEEEIDVAEAGKQDLEDAIRHNAEIDELSAVVATEVDRITALENELQECRKALERNTKALEGAEKIDATALQSKIDEATALNARIRSNQDRRREQAAFDDLRIQSVGLTEDIDAIDYNKSQKLSEAEFPVADLSFDVDGVLLNGLPLDQASGAEQLRVSTAMGFALNPELKVLLIRDGSLLDDDSLALVAGMADEAGGQVWIERVGEGDEVSVVIEDGQVKE